MDNFDIGESWGEVLKPIIEGENFKQIMSFI